MASCRKPDFNSNLMKLTSLLQLVDKLQQAGKTHNFTKTLLRFRLCTHWNSKICRRFDSNSSHRTILGFEELQDEVDDFEEESVEFFIKEEQTIVE